MRDNHTVDKYEFYLAGVVLGCSMRAIGVARSIVHNQPPLNGKPSDLDRGQGAHTGVLCSGCLSDTDPLTAAGIVQGPERLITSQRGCTRAGCEAEW